MRIFRSSGRFLSWFSMAATACLAIFVACSAVAAADVIYVKASATGAGDGSSWDDAFTNVGPALAAAQSGDQVWVAQGTYVGYITLKEGVALYGGFAGTEDPAFDLACRDLEANQAILDGDQAGSVVTAPSGATPATLIDGFAITNGKSDDGGGIFCDTSSPTISNCTITGNTAMYYGGGIYCSSSSSPTISNCTITLNGSENGGGGICSYDSSAELTRCTIADNSMSWRYRGSGGGVYSMYGSSLLLDECTVICNTAEHGGGLTADSSSTFIIRCVISGNDASYGGGIYSADSTTTISDSTLAENSAREGGGICLHSSDTAITDCTISDNTAEFDGNGGGIASSGSRATIEGNIIIGNKAPYAGGGAIAFGLDDSFVNDNIIADNVAAEFGGGIWCYRSDALIEANTIANNITAEGSGAGIACTESAPSIIGNTISDNVASIHGAGLHCYFSSPSVTGNVISGNLARQDGGGISCSFSNPQISSNIITGNAAAERGGGLSVKYEPSPSLTNTIFANNSAPSGGGIHCFLASLTVDGITVTRNSASSGIAIALLAASADISNSIFWGNTNGYLADVALSYSSRMQFRHSNIPEGYDSYILPGEILDIDTTNIHTDPLFADPDNGDYHLKSRYGRWDPAANDGEGGWVSDDVTSPCIDAGDPASPYQNEPMPNLERTNIGAYGNTPEASKSGWNIKGDADADCRVNILDLLLVRNSMLKDVSSDDNWKADVNNDGKIDVIDLIFVRNRLNTACTE